MAASINAVRGLDWMTRPTQVNCHKHRQRKGAKDADRLQPKWRTVRCTAYTMPRTRAKRLSVERQGLNHPKLLERNMVNPSSLLSKEGPPQGRLLGCRVEERWRKPTPLCNGADRSCNITPPRKRADFQYGQSLREHLSNLRMRKSK